MQHRFIESRRKPARSVPHKFTLSCLFICLPVWKPILCKLFSFLCFPLLHRHSQKLRPPYCFYYSSSCSSSLSHPLFFFFFFPLCSVLFLPHSYFHQLKSGEAEEDQLEPENSGEGKRGMMTRWWWRGQQILGSCVDSDGYTSMTYLFVEK